MYVKRVHFLLRYSDKLANGSDTLAEHRAIIESNGCVWLGKFGIGMSSRFAELAINQIRMKQPCFLYLMHGSKLTAKSNIIDIATAGTNRGEIPSREPNLTPFYYRGRKCSVWFKLDTMDDINNEEIKKLWLYNNPASHPSLVGMRGLIYLTPDNSKTELNVKGDLKPSIYTEGFFD
ncbi:hypothetical protein [Aeromonas caviae]|uniref:hypothetical protein n=1 Tax=Aeromonas caviae TaxID=648 RepID=UPI000F51C0CF|nr:hypothetical protein [Aeromonas caviae]RQM52082.1 hypothetical protein EHZ50_12740 [Aeromonas caviae]